MKIKIEFNIEFKILIAGVVLLLTSCATPFKEAHTHPDGRRGAFGYRIEPVQKMAPFTNYAAFTGNKDTSVEQAKAYTEMAALIHCREQGQFLMVDSNVRNVNDKIKITKQMIYETGDRSAKTQINPNNYKAFMVLFGCSNKNSGTKMSERRRILKAFCTAKDTNQGKYCSAKSLYRQ